jgi:iron(III) transport system permease protein
MTLRPAEAGEGLPSELKGLPSPHRAPSQPLSSNGKGFARTRRARSDFWWLAAAALITALALLPLAGVVYFALRGSGDVWPNLIQNVLPEALRVTLLLLLGVGAMVAIIGVGTAWLVTMFVFPGRRIFEWALLLPLAVPTYIVAYAYLDVLHPIGPVQSTLRALLGIARPRDLWFPEIRTLHGCIFLLGVVLYPYVYLPVRALFLMQSAATLEVARTLGANRIKVFFRVAVPLARPAIAIGVSLALMEALNDIGASEFLGVRTLTVAIYTTWTVRMSVEGAAEIALVMLAFVFALILFERWVRRNRRYSSHAKRLHTPVPQPLGPFAAAGATLACSAPIVFGFLVPGSYLVFSSWRRFQAAGLPSALGGWIENSVMLAALTTISAIIVSLVLVYSVRLTKNPAAPVLVRLASIGYAVPGTVLAVGLLVPLASLDNAVDAAMRSSFGISTGLVLTGSGAALILAYVIRFLAISTGGIEAGLAKVSPHLDMAARSLGSRPAKVLVRIHLPLIAPAIAAAAALVFVDVMKELPATLLLQPFNFTTLATALYGEAKRGTYEDGAIAALAIVLVGLIPVIVLARVNAGMAPPRRSSSAGQSSELGAHL